MLRKLGLILIKAIIAILALIILMNIGIYLIEDQRFKGTEVPFNHQYSFNQPFTETFFQSSDLGIIHLVCFTKPKPNGVLYYLPGRTADVEYTVNLLKNVFNLNYDIAILEYRTWGKSRGIISEVNFYQDALRGYALLKKKYGENNIVIIGHSFGGAIAAKTAACNNPRRLILIASIYSINEKFKYKPWHFWKYKMETGRFIQNLKTPITYICGTKDDLYPASVRLKDAGKKSDSLWTVPGEGHISIFNSPKLIECINAASF